MTTLSAGAPLEQPSLPIGRRTVSLVDGARSDRRMDLDIWYPAVASAAEQSIYEIFPGVAFSAAVAQHHAPTAVGSFPVVLFSHGRTGMRISYSMLCEALAARGAVVVSADHPGDALADWLTAQQVDDRTNETNRVGDAHFVLDALLHGHQEIPAAITEIADPARVFLAGHSYGAYTAYATAAGARGVAPREEVLGVIGYQPFMRTMSETLLQRVRAASLLVVAELDTTTPADINADRAWEHLASRPSWRLDLAGCGHQAVSDIALYAELADAVPDLPQLVRDYLMATVAGSTGPGTRPWRQVVSDQVQVTWAFMQAVCGADPSIPAGVQLQRR